MTKKLIYEIGLRKEISKNPYNPFYGNKTKYIDPIFKRRYRALLRQHYMLELSYLARSFRALFRERNYGFALYCFEDFLSARMSREYRLGRRGFFTRVMSGWLYRRYRYE